MPNKKIIKKIVYVKSGTGHITPRIPIPIEWTRDMQLNENEKEVEIEYDLKKKELIIKKVNK